MKSGIFAVIVLLWLYLHGMKSKGREEKDFAILPSLNAKVEDIWAVV